jgi:hypothetical protein
MKLRIFWIFFLIFSAGATLAETDEDGYNEITIHPSDIPTDAPRFKDYPAKIFSGKNAAPNLRSDSKTKMYRSRLAQWAKEKPNFAGHYILAYWGCGTDCTQIAIIDAKTGKIYHPTGITANVAVNVHYELLKDGDFWHGSGAIKFRPDSRLLILIGIPEERTKDRGISYYVWEHNRARRVRFIPKAWYPEDK